MCDPGDVAPGRTSIDGEHLMSTSSSAAARWLAVGRDVLLTGDAGAGKSWALRDVATTATARGSYSVLSIRAQHTLRPFGPFRAHDSAPRGELSEKSWVAWMREELSGRRPLLLVDDLDRVDDATVAVVRTFLSVVDARMVATVGTDVRALYTSPAALLVAERAPARVRVEAMGLSETSRLLTSALGGPASIGVVSAIATRSAGNPRVALALADAARVEGVVRVEGGVWVKAGTMDSIAVDSVAHGLLPQVPAEQLEALVVLAEHGTLDERDAALLVGGDVLSALVRRGRVVMHRCDGTHTVVAVSPPALGRALRTGTLGPRALSGASSAQSEGSGVRTTEEGARCAGRVAGPGAERLDHLDRSAVQTRASASLPAAPEEYPRWAAEIAVLVHARSEDEVARHRATWLLAPTVDHANAFLAVLLRRPADPVEVETIFSATEQTDGDTPESRALFDVLATRWAVWSDSSAGSDPTTRPGSVAAQRARLAAERAAARPGEDEDIRAATREAAAGVPVAGWARVLESSALLEAGRPDLALAVCEQVDGTVESTEQMHYLDGIQSESLLMLGRVSEAEHHARAALERALDSLDGLGIRVNACALAVVLGTRGQSEDAWRTLTVSLRLGSPGPLENTYYRRSLALGTLLRTRVGDSDLARALSTELDLTPSGYSPLLQSMGEVARTALDPDPEKVEELWAAGERHVEAGLLLPALWCWLAHPGPHSPERVRQVRDLYARCRLPLLDSLVRLHEALSAGDLAVLEVLAGPTTTIVNDAPRRTAWTMLGGRHGDGSALAPAEPGDPGEGPPLLTTRERQIALLARDGLSNREIATEFTLSVRTVENHMSSLLHKLGFTSRQDLTLHMFV